MNGAVYKVTLEERRRCLFFSFDFKWLNSGALEEAKPESLTDVRKGEN